MEIVITPCLSGAAQAEGVVIVVDVFRAGNTAAALLSRKAPFIIPVGSLEEAKQIKQTHPDYLLVGERGGLKPEGFEMNNSPSGALSLDLAGRPVIMTTSAGTQGLTAAAPKAQALLMATLVNASAATRYVRDLKPELVTIVPIGLAGKERAVEDDVTAEYLAGLLQNQPPDYRSIAPKMLKGNGADRLRSLGQWRDLAFCLRLDHLQVVPVVEKGHGHLVLKPVMMTVEGNNPR